MDTLFVGKNCFKFDEITSTNDWLMTRISNQKFHEGTVAFASVQTNGKGQRGSQWFSQPYKSLTFSVLLKPRFLSPIHAFDLSICVALALSDSLNKLRSGFKIKWPNDLLIDGKKIGGILCETKIEKNDIKNMVIGVGVNVNESIAEHDESIQKNLTTMFEVSKHPHQRELIVAEFINSFELLLNKLSTEPSQIIEEWLKKCMHLNEKILFLQNKKVIEGVFCGLDDNGFAKIKINNEIKSYSSINLI